MISSTPLGGPRHGKSYQAALVGHIQRIETKNLTGRGDRLRNGYRGLVQFDAQRCVQGDLVYGGGQAPAGQIAKTVQVRADFRHRCNQPGQRSAIAGDRGFEAQPFTDRHHGHAVPPESPLTMTASPGATRGGAMSMPAAPPRRRRVDEDAVAFAAIDDLGVPGDDPHARLAAGRAIDSTTRRSVSIGRPSSRMKPALARAAGAAHRQVVHRAVNRQLADVAAGKEQRPHHEGVGGEGQPAPRISTTAPSCARPEGPLAKAGRNRPSIRFRMNRPPPPCASWTVACSTSGTGQESVKS